LIEECAVRVFAVAGPQFEDIPDLDTSRGVYFRITLRTSEAILSEGDVGDDIRLEIASDIDILQVIPFFVGAGDEIG
jgi:hypothetical protein